jgi:penicillin-binding protein 2
VFRKKRKFTLALPGEKSNPVNQREDERTLTRRMLLLRGAVGAGFVALGAKLWNMQIAQGSDFEDFAEGNVLRFERLKAARGRIVDREGRTLAENRRAWTVRVVPNRLPSDNAGRLQVLETLSSTLGLGTAVVLDRSLIPLGSEAAVVNAVEDRLQLDGDTLLAELQRERALVLLKGELTPADAEAMAQTLSDQLAVRVVSMLEYQLAVHDSDDLPMIVKKDVPHDDAIALAANAIYLKGVTVDDNDLFRQYPGKHWVSHILGYVGPISEKEYEAATTVGGTPIYDPDDIVGRGGIEQALEQELRGTKGGRWIQVDAQGVERFELLDRRREPISGLSAQLTIDLEFQTKVTEALQEGIQIADQVAQREDREEVKAGVAIALNPQNGEILAMVSLPTFDNQLFVDGISDEQFQAYQNDEYTPLINRAISGTYAPGSVFKPLMACAGLQEGVMDVERQWDCRGAIRVPWSWDEAQGNDYYCWVGEPGHGMTDIYSGIADSCDVYFYNVGAPRQKPDEPANADFVHYYNPRDSQRYYFEGLGIERIEKYLLESFGYGRPTGIELVGEAEGLVPNPRWLYQTIQENWSIGDTINVSIGQGHLLNTPLQLLNATAAIANGGTLWRPRLVKALVREDGRVVKDFPAAQINQLAIDRQHIETVRLGMRQAITSGTGAGIITITDPTIAGKSGTAEFGIAVDGKYKRSHAWFTAFGPYEKPEISVAVLIVGGIAGSTYAGPVTNKILEAYFGGKRA